MEKDIDRPESIKEFMITDFMLNCMERITEGLRKKSTHRAWRLTGDYGSGKSTFALFLAHWFSGSRNQFQPSVRNALHKRKIFHKAPNYITVLVTGSRAPLGLSILKSLYHSLKQINKPINLNQIKKLLKTDDFIPDEHIIQVLNDVNTQIIKSKLGNGLLLIIDELGKFLEFSILNPDQQDIFLLQQLADNATRSFHKPFFLIALLHQGLNAYADQFSQSSQRELEKVAGRFEEVIFNQPIEQNIHLISSALNTCTKKISQKELNSIQFLMKETINIGWFGNAPAKNLLMDCSKKLYPIHPTVLPVIVRIFHRFGQNERSLFSFLLSNEPFGLQQFAENQLLEHCKKYRLSDLYDYVKFNFGYRLNVGTYRTNWNHIQSMIDSYNGNNALELDILKTVGILNLINQNDLIATEQSIILSLSDSTFTSEKIKQSINTLHNKKRILYYRGVSGGYCLWPHTSVDLDEAYEKAERSTAFPKSVSKLVKNYIDSTPIVARRHYITTGNLRYFTVTYCPLSDVSSINHLIEKHSHSDGSIIVILYETKEDYKKVLELTLNSKFKNIPNVLIAVPKPLNYINKTLYELQKWEWISKNTPELSVDQFAVKEVSQRIDFYQSAFANQIHTLVGLRKFIGKFALELYQTGKKLTLASGRDFLSFLSGICDDRFSKAPIIKNELINRQLLSSAAAAARMRLIERILEYSDKPFLGMNPDKKPPEMSIYLSVLKKSNLHCFDKNIGYLRLPQKDKDICNILPIFNCIKKLIHKRPGKKVSILQIYSKLSLPPYGVREGLIPLFIAVFKVIYEHEVAFYENGSFLRIVAGEEFLRLTKIPKSFEIQYCKIEGVRTDIFNKMILALNLKRSTNQNAELLDVVQPLCIFVADLPNYVKTTKKLSQITINVRDHILSAEEPIKLLFDDLPVACNFEPFEADNNIDEKKTQQFVNILKKSLTELKQAYPELIERLKKQIQQVFNNSDQFLTFKKQLSQRAEKIAITITEPKQKAFCLRIMDDMLPENEWIESIGSFIASKPPENWNALDEDIFKQKLIERVSQFFRVETTIFSKDNTIDKNSIGMRFALTLSDGNEQENVFYINQAEEKEVEILQKKIETMIKEHQNIALAAAFRALWNVNNK